MSRLTYEEKQAIRRGIRADPDPTLAAFDWFVAYHETLERQREDDQRERYWRATGWVPLWVVLVVGFGISYAAVWVNIAQLWHAVTPK